MKAKIRFLATPMPEAIDYLRPLANGPHDVAVVPMGPVGLNLPPWDEFATLFLNSPAERYVNVVCAPRGVELTGPIVFDPSRPETSSFIPGTVFAVHWTKGVTNIAMIIGDPFLTVGDFEALRRYDVVTLMSSPEQLADIIYERLEK